MRDHATNSVLAGLADARDAARRFGVRSVERTGRGWRPVIKSAAEATRRLAAIRAEGTADRRLAVLSAARNAAPPPPRSTPQIALRRDHQGRVRVIGWSVGPVVVSRGERGAYT